MTAVFGLHGDRRRFTLHAPLLRIVFCKAEELFALLHVVVRRPGGALQRRCRPDAEILAARRAQRRPAIAAPDGCVQ